MNAVNIIGIMTRDLELKYLQSGSAVGSFSIAVNQDYKDKNGQKVEKTSFFEVSVFGKQAEIVSQYFHKGSRIGITGELEQQTWQDQQGGNRSKVVIKLQSFSFIDRKANNQQQGYNQQQQPATYYDDTIPTQDDAEIPF